jgi:hypothetical protein
MEKRSSFERIPRDFNPTPYPPVPPLIPHLRGVRSFAESRAAVTVRWCAIWNRLGCAASMPANIVTGQDALATADYGEPDAIITNPPFMREVMHKLIAHFQNIAPTWLLLGAATANFVSTGYATSPDECRTQIGTAFHRMLTRDDLRERPDAKPGPPRREQVIDGPAGPLRPYDCGKDILLGPMVRSERRITIRRTDRRIALALDPRRRDLVVDLERRGAPRRRRLRLARRCWNRPRRV